MCLHLGGFVWIVVFGDIWWQCMDVPFVRNAWRCCKLMLQSHVRTSTEFIVSTMSSAKHFLRFDKWNLYHLSLILPLEKNKEFWSFIGQDFFYMWEKYHLSHSSFSCFSHKYPIFWTNNVQILFVCLNMHFHTGTNQQNDIWSKNDKI